MSYHINRRELILLKEGNRKWANLTQSGHECFFLNEARADLHGSGLLHRGQWLPWPREPRDAAIPYGQEAPWGAAGQPGAVRRPLEAAEPAPLEGCTNQRGRSPRVDVLDASEDGAAVGS